MKALLKESDATTLREFASLLENTLHERDDLKAALKTQQERADLLGQDKLQLKRELEHELTRHRWQPVTKGECPEDVRVLVRGKDKYVQFGGFNGAVWLSGRMVLDFEPLEWMLVPD